jgi:hypothetical protein
MLLLLLLLLHRLVEGRSSCALWHAWALTESFLSVMVPDIAAAAAAAAAIV